MKFRMAWFALAIPLLLVGSVAAYSGPTPNLSLTLSGGVVSPGVQTYSLRGGQLVEAFVLGNPVSTTNTFLQYSLNAVVSGLTVTGTASFSLGSWASQSSSSLVSGSVKINAMTPAVFFPLGCTPGVSCSSEIPALFNGTGTVTFSGGGAATTLSLNMGFESAYLNPFGGPIIFASSNGAIVVVAGYSQASIRWTDVQMGGTAAGTFEGASISGGFGMLVNSSEDLKSGIEFDYGAISFFGMSNPALNGVGSFSGISTIPWGSGVACPGFPPGTCNLTGLQSSGAFSMITASGAMIVGHYSTTWAIPAVAFTSNITGNLGTPRHHYY